MKPLRPRSRARLLWGVPLCLLFALGYVADRRATALRYSSLSSSISALETRVGDVERRPAAAPSAHADAPGAAPALESAPRPSPLPSPRVLGSGRSGAWAYTDVRLPSRDVRRYYVRTNSTPEQFLSVLRTMRADILDSMQDCRPEYE